MSSYIYDHNNPNEWVLNPTTRFAPTREIFFKSLVLVSGLSGMGKGVFGEEQNLNVISSGDLFRLTNSEDAKRGVMPNTIERIRIPFIQTFKKYIYGFLQGFDSGMTSTIPMVALDGIIRHGDQIIEVGSFINQALIEVKTELSASDTDVDRRHVQYIDQILTPTDKEAASETAKSIPKFNEYNQTGQSLEGAQNLALGFVSYANSVLIDGTKTDAERQILFRVVSNLLKKHKDNGRLAEDMAVVKELLQENAPDFTKIDSILALYPSEKYGYRVDDARHEERVKRMNYMYETSKDGVTRPGTMAQALEPFGYKINQETWRFELAGNRENSFMFENGMQSGVQFKDYLQRCRESRELLSQLSIAYEGQFERPSEGSIFNASQAGPLELHVNADIGLPPNARK